MQLDQKLHKKEAKVEDLTRCLESLRSLHLKLCDDWRIFKTTLENPGEIDDGFVHF